jgi:hypothetical protein
VKEPVLGSFSISPPPFFDVTTLYCNFPFTSYPHFTSQSTMKRLPGIIIAILCVALLLSSSVARQSASGGLTERALVTSAQCDDAQDAIMTNPIFHGPLFANATIDKRLADGTQFRRSTAYVYEIAKHKHLISSCNSESKSCVHLAPSKILA